MSKDSRADWIDKVNRIMNDPTIPTEEAPMTGSWFTQGVSVVTEITCVALRERLMKSMYSPKNKLNLSEQKQIIVLLGELDNEQKCYKLLLEPRRKKPRSKILNILIANREKSFREKYADLFRIVNILEEK